MKPWREVVIPHPDVLEGTFQQSEFAADINSRSQGRSYGRISRPCCFF